MRIDKYLNDCLSISRSNIKGDIKKGFVKINDIIIKDASMHINDEDIVKYKDEIIKYQKYHYYALYKPAGIITATSDSKDKTVLDLIPTELRNGLFPVGRLDKDTEGLIILTNDGELAHRLLSSKYHVDKGYICHLEKNVTSDDIIALENGINIGDDTPTLPSKATLIDEKTVLLYIIEGRYHQIKRMFQALCNKVNKLERISFGPIILKDLNIESGQFIELTPLQIQLLRDYKYDKTTN